MEFSALQNGLSSLVLLNLLVEFDQEEKIIKENVRNESYTYPLVTEVAKTVIPYLRFDWD